jgi:polysaccharide export outer membrane protein
VALSTDDDRLNRIFIPNSSSAPMQQGQGISGTQFYFTGFTLTDKGELELPYLGKIIVGGKTIEEAKETIEKELQKYFKVFFFQVKVAEFKFSVLGYVNKPGQFFFQQNKVNLLEAIAQAGELQSLSKRKEIQLYRQYPDGVRLHVIDLTDRSIINSNLWFIQPNDVLYVHPLDIRTIGDLSSLQNSFSVIAPLLGSLLLVLNTYILIVNLK